MFLSKSNVISLFFALTSVSPLFASDTAAKGTTTLCLWKFGNGKSDPVDNKAPCVTRILRTNPTIIEEYKANDQTFLVEHLPEKAAMRVDLKQKVKLNGKLATMEEDNRYSFNITTDDLKLSFSHTEVLSGTEDNEPKFTSATAAGVWVANPKTDCRRSAQDDPRTISIKGNTLTRDGGESVCRIMHTGYAANGTASGFIFAKCQNEEASNVEAINFTMAKNGKDAIGPGLAKLRRCP